MLTTIICAAFGGLIINVLNLLEIGKIPKDRRPDFKDFFYWLPYLLWPLLGAGLAAIYIKSGVELKPILAMNVGISAPLIIRSMATINPFSANTQNPGVGA